MSTVANPYAPPPRPGRSGGPDRPRRPGWRSWSWRRLPRWLHWLHWLQLPPALRTAAWRARSWKPLALGLLGLALLALAAGLAGSFQYQDLASVPLPAGRTAAAGRRVAPARIERLIVAQRPRGIYIEVDTMANRLYLMRGDRVLREAVCSTGTGGLLVDPASGRRWVFDTPRGTHRILGKTKNPVWNKPDWAFIEEGQPIPSDAAARVDTYSLGDYALSMGDGYLIHGTLYQRLLGRSVTHGCIRLGDEDLAAVYAAVPIGSPVYVF
jgi:L,D-transpeptidase catalytic domain